MLPAAVPHSPPAAPAAAAVNTARPAAAVANAAAAASAAAAAVSTELLAGASAGTRVASAGAQQALSAGEGSHRQKQSMMGVPCAAAGDAWAGRPPLDRGVRPPEQGGVACLAERPSPVASSPAAAAAAACVQVEPLHDAVVAAVVVVAAAAAAAAACTQAAPLHAAAVTPLERLIPHGTSREIDLSTSRCLDGAVNNCCRRVMIQTRCFKKRKMNLPLAAGPGCEVPGCCWKGC